MISSTLAVLKSPANGVSGAVTGYPIGRGDGVSTVFAAPPEITAVTTLYRRDWQGTVALSASARTNLLRQSEALSDASWTKQTGVSVTPDAAQAPDGTMTADLVDLTSAADTKGVLQSLAGAFTGLTLTRSIWLKGVIGGEVVRLLDPSRGEAYTQYILTTSWQRCSLTSAQQTTGGGLWVRRTSAGSPKIYAWGAQLEVADIPTPYIPTTAAPVTVTDYVASGTTLTLAEVPARAAELTVDGTGVDLPLLQIGG